MTDIRAVLKTLAVALPFGLAAFICVYGGLTASIPSTGVATDPREFFATPGAAFANHALQFELAQVGAQGQGVVIGVAAG